MLVDFLRCEVGNGERALFWYDHWLDCGPLISLIGASGPRQLRIPLDACVNYALRDGEWFLPPARSREAELLQITLTTLAPPSGSRGADVYLWRIGAGQFGNKFSTKSTWEFMRSRSPLVTWSKVVWFKQEIPRCSFITWLALLARLPTRNRLQRWGMSVPSFCVLCSQGIENHNHIFFECTYSADLWQGLSAGFALSQNLDILSVATSIDRDNSLSRSSKGVVIRLLLQVCTYLLWKERNSRIFVSTSSPVAVLRAEALKMMRDRLISFPATSVTAPSLLEVFFRYIAGSV